MPVNDIQIVIPFKSKGPDLPASVCNIHYLVIWHQFKLILLIYNRICSCLRSLSICFCSSVSQCFALTSSHRLNTSILSGCSGMCCKQSKVGLDGYRAIPGCCPACNIFKLIRLRSYCIRIWQPIA